MWRSSNAIYAQTPTDVHSVHDYVCLVQAESCKTHTYTKFGMQFANAIGTRGQNNFPGDVDERRVACLPIWAGFSEGRKEERYC